MLLSCSHVFAPLDMTGPQVESPPDASALTFTNLVANLGQFEPLTPGGNVVNRMDAALAVPIPERISGLNNVVPGLGPITSASQLQSGEFAQNGIQSFVGVGAVSGQISGSLIAENVSSLFQDSRGRVFLFQDIVAYTPDPVTREGDSGMPILRQTGDGIELLGMHIGVSIIQGTHIRAAFFVPIRVALDRFDVNLL